MSTVSSSTSGTIWTPITGATTGTTSSNSSSTSRTPGGELGKMEFLKLLTAQLSHQDPMDPADGKQMAADLAQFSGLEQLLNINTALSAQSTQSTQILQALNNSAAMNAVGKTAIVSSDQVVLSKDANGNMGGQIMTDVTTSGVGTLTILDKSGKEVGTRSLGYVSSGSQKTFDVGSAGDKLSAGAYTFRVDVVDPTTGKGVQQATYAVGKIDGLTYGSDGAAQLAMGPLTVAYSAIVKILS